MLSVLHIVVFLLGIHMGMQSIAAAYLVVDLGYDRRGNARLIVGGIVGWWGAAGAIYWLLSERVAPTYAYGMLSSVLLYVLLFYSIRYLLSQFAVGDV